MSLHCFCRSSLQADPRCTCDPQGDGRGLISQGLYPVYLRQLRLWLMVVVSLLATIGALSAALADEPAIGSVVMGILRGAGTAVLQVCFWVTIVFAAMERFSAASHQDSSGKPTVFCHRLGLRRRCEPPVAVAAPSRHEGTGP